MVRRLFHGCGDAKSGDIYTLVKHPIPFPVLCLHGASDPIVHNINSVKFVKKVNTLRPGTAQLFIESNIGEHHTSIAGGMFVDKFPALDVFLDWLERIETSTL